MDKNNRNNRINNLINFETPEKPRAKKPNPNKELIEKAKKYDELMQKIKSDKAMCEIALSELKERRSFRFGYLNGYNDGKAAGYEYIVECLLQKYIEG